MNTKVALVAGGDVLSVRGRPYEIQHDPQALVPLLRKLATEVGGDAPETAHAVTMTAELSQMFRTKSDGVAFVLDAVTTAFPSSLVRVFSVDGCFLSVEDARRVPLDVAAANWAATAHAVARHHPNTLLIDIGTTSTDIIPIAGGVVVAEGRTDPARLATGELVYTGAVRTPAEAIASRVKVGRLMVGVSAEGFALAGDAHVWRGSLAPADYTSPTPDGRPATREHAGVRLARVVCADRDMLDEGAVSSIADGLATAQIARVTDAIRRVCARHPSLGTAVVTGLGAFIATAAAQAAGLQVVPLATELGDVAARCAPAVSVALLLEQELSGVGSRFPQHQTKTTPDTEYSVDAVVKLGGGVLAHPGQFEIALAAVAAAGRRHRLLIVPGGGPFADAVRDADRRLHLEDEAAHWMAVLAMDQFAHMIAARLAGGELISGADDIAGAFGMGRIPVLAPYRWLRETDPLPHSWEVTSDSIAAWVAGALGAKRLVLIKPPGVTGGDAVDAYFAHALPTGMTARIVAADDVEALDRAWTG